MIVRLIYLLYKKITVYIYLSVRIVFFVNNIKPRESTFKTPIE